MLYLCADTSICILSCGKRSSALKGASSGETLPHAQMPTVETTGIAHVSDSPERKAARLMNAIPIKCGDIDHIVAPPLRIITLQKFD